MLGLCFECANLKMCQFLISYLVKLHCSVHIGPCVMNNYLFQAMYYTLYFHSFCMCGSATLAQVLQDNSKEFVDKMNSEAIAPTLFTLDLIPEKVKRAIMQSMSKEDANTILNDHLKMEVEKVQTVRKIFEVASEKSGYGRMNTFAKGMLEKLAAVQ